MDRKEPRSSAKYNGFDVHCAVRVADDDDEGRERLIRYCARAPFALERIELMKDGRIAYQLKTPRRGSSHRVMTPVEFLSRLAILVPPPYFPLVRYHGVFGARSSWRALVTPKPPVDVTPRSKSKACSDAKSAKDAGTPLLQAPSTSPSGVSSAPPLASIALPEASSPALAVSHQAPRSGVDAAATTITVKHWNRLLKGELFATSSRVEWAVLLQRTFGLDALRCPTCAAKMRVMATIIEPCAVKKILSHLGLRTEPLPLARARDPTGQVDFGFDAA